MVDVGYKRRVGITVAIESKGRYLLTRQGKGGHLGFWGFPGGGLEIDETSLEEALDREVKEEVGITIKNVKPIGVHLLLNKQDKVQILLVFFKAEIKSGEVGGSDEISEWQWLSLRELKKFPRNLIRPPTSWFEVILPALEQNRGIISR